MEPKFEIMLFFVLMDVLILYQVFWKGIREAWKLSQFSADSLETTGSVIDYHVTENSDHQNEYGGIVRFSLEGKEYVLYDNDFNFKRPEIGKKVSVHFHSVDPKSGIVNIHTKIKKKLGICLLWLILIVIMNIVAYKHVFD